MVFKGKIVITFLVFVTHVVICHIHKARKDNSNILKEYQIFAIP